jgi:flagellar protein FlaG
MEPKIEANARLLDPAPTQVQPGSASGKPEAKPVATGPDPVDIRLVIEEGEVSGSYVYKTINRVTGEVLQQFPREDLLKLQSGDGYKSGAIVRTEA